MRATNSVIARRRATRQSSGSMHRLDCFAALAMTNELSAFAPWREPKLSFGLTPRRKDAKTGCSA